MTEQPQTKKTGGRKKIIFIVLGVVLFLIILCIIVGSCAPSVEDAEVVKTSAIPSTLSDTSTPIATSTKTLIPTETNTPIPSDTPVPTQVPEPVIFEGSGDDIVDIGKIWTTNFGAVAFLHIVGPSVYDNFIVYSYDMDGNKIDLLVNTIGYYNGYLLLLSPVSRLEISSGGAWTVEALPFIPEYTHFLEVPGTYNGNGDDVILLKGSPDLAKFDATEYDNFIVYSHTSFGRKDLLINEIGPYSGTKILPNTTFILEVKASGAWSVEITE